MNKNHKNCPVITGSLRDLFMVLILSLIFLLPAYAVGHVAENTGIENMDGIENVGGMDTIDAMESMDNLDALEGMQNTEQNMDSIPTMESMDALEGSENMEKNIEGIDALDSMEDMKSIDGLENMDSNMDSMEMMDGKDSMQMKSKESSTMAEATFAGGCFWCLEPPFDKLPGVTATIPGYSGGDVVNPTYKQVSGGRSGHVEVLRVQYDPEKISYEQLLQVFWRNIDPTTPNQQFCDRGEQYRSEIFYHDKQQQQLADASLQALQKKKPFPGEIVTAVTSLKNFYPAEDYHQDYYLKNPLRYKFYRYRCGRDQRLRELWGENEKSG